MSASMPLDVWFVRGWVIFADLLNHWGLWIFGPMTALALIMHLITLAYNAQMSIAKPEQGSKLAVRVMFGIIYGGYVIWRIFAALAMLANPALESETESRSVTPAELNTPAIVMSVVLAVMIIMVAVMTKMWGARGTLVAFVLQIVVLILAIGYDWLLLGWTPTAIAIAVAVIIFLLKIVFSLLREVLNGGEK